MPTPSAPPMLSMPPAISWAERVVVPWSSKLPDQRGDARLAGRIGRSAGPHEIIRTLTAGCS